MEIHFVKSTFDEIQPMMIKYADTLSSPIDSFLEEHILNSRHYVINIEGKQAGYFSIHDGSLITQFYIERQYRSFGQRVFYDIRRMEFASSAFVPTSDEFMLSHALDQYRSLEHQAYFFQDSKAPIPEYKIDRTLKIRLAAIEDKETVENLSGDFFNKLKERIQRQEIYMAEKNGAPAGFGIIEYGVVLKNCASIGMFTVESARQGGVGRNILLHLKDEVYKKGLTPIAGCWYYNHYSKKTLESAGMYSNTRLFKVNY